MRSVASLSRGFALALAAALMLGPEGAQAHDPVAQWTPHYPSLPLHQDVGGPFQLTDHRGNTFTQDDFRGHYSLLYFGYTSCPDICALALYTISVSLDEVGADEGLLIPYFINLDPERESLVDLTEYLGYFHERFVGLTGTAEQLRVAAGAYAVRYKQVPDGEDDRKTVHSGMIFLLDPTGEAVAMLPHDVPQDWLTATLREHVQHVTSEAISTRIEQ